MTTPLDRSRGTRAWLQHFPRFEGGYDSRWSATSDGGITWLQHFPRFEGGYDRRICLSRQTAFGLQHFPRFEGGYDRRICLSRQTAFGLQHFPRFEGGYDCPHERHNQQCHPVATLSPF